MTKNSNELEIIILAAGLGTRMKSDKPKVLHSVCGQPMLGVLLRNLEKAIDHLEIKKAYFNIVVGHRKELVMEYVESLKKSEKLCLDVYYSVQEKQLGTGHAVKMALENKKLTQADKNRCVAVFNGDLPLFGPEDFLSFYQTHLKEKSSASLVSGCLNDPAQYGRVVRKGKKFLEIVEFKDAKPAQKNIKEINAGVYLFEFPVIKKLTEKFSTKNAAHEFYLPDAFKLALKEKKKTAAIQTANIDSIRGVNTFAELAEAQKILYFKTAQKWQSEGVFIHDAQNTFIGDTVKIGKGTEIFPMTWIQGDSEIGQNVTIGFGCQLKNIKIGNSTVVKNLTHAEDTQIGNSCTVGPMVHFRSGTKLGNDIRIGNFVEIKQASIGDHTNAAHLSYIGDAEIGSNVNVGCGFVTCNFDGRMIDGKRKHLSKIGSGVFIGSDCQVIAPIEIAEGTYIASGSTVSESVEEKDSLVIARSRQTTKPGYAQKYKKYKKS